MRGTDIVYQWINCDEHAVTDIRYSMRSLEQHWIGRFRVTVVGDRPPGFAQLYHLQTEVITTEHHQRALDAARKMQAMVNAPHLQDRFVLMHDDQYLLKPMDEQYISVRRAVSEISKDWTPPNASRKHKVLLHATAQALFERGLKRVWNYETHIPRLYDKRKLGEVMDIYRPAGNRLLVATLYFNHHWPNQEPEMMHMLDDVKVAFFGSRDRGTVPPAPTSNAEEGMAYYAKQLVGKHFMNHNNRGIADFNLQYLRHSLYPTPSAFEPRTSPILTAPR